MLLKTKNRKTLVLVEVVPVRRVIDVTIRIHGDFTKNFRISRMILECVETLAKDCFQLEVKVSIPFIHKVFALLINILTLFKHPLHT
jgi:hypothetical protein